MRTITLCLAVFAAGALAPTAAAKGPISVEICGASGCQKFPDRTHWRLVTGVLEVSNSFAFESPPTVTRYYALRLNAGWLEGQSARRMFYLPSRRLMNVQQSWVKVGARLARLLRAATRDMTPWPRPSLARVTVNGRRAEPAPYAALLQTLPVAEPTPELGEAVEIRLYFERPTPWTSTRRAIRYFPSQDILHRDTEWLRPPPELARWIEADAGLTRREPAPPPSRSARGTLIAAAAAATLAALAAAFAVRRSRRPRAASA